MSDYQKAASDTAETIVNVVKSAGDPQRVNSIGVTLAWAELHALLKNAYIAGAELGEKIGREGALDSVRGRS